MRAGGVLAGELGLLVGVLGWAFGLQLTSLMSANLCAPRLCSSFPAGCSASEFFRATVHPLLLLPRQPPNSAHAHRHTYTLPRPAPPQASVPLAEMFSYVSTLRSMSKGRAQYGMHLERYDVVPMNIQKEIIEKSQVSAA